MLRFSKSRVPLLLIGLVAHGFADNIFCMCIYRISTGVTQFPQFSKREKVSDLKNNSGRYIQAQ